ncbi:alpha-ketoacid dehydrogenase subunit beta, partial [Acinetobacter baumannii]
MPNKSFRNAIKEAIESEMRRDPTVFVVGEDVRGGHGGKNTEENQLEGFGGVLGVTKGLWTEFGSERVIDTPITESAIIGMAAGAAATGLRPVADLMFMDFYGVCHDMLYN